MSLPPPPEFVPLKPRRRRQRLPAPPAGPPNPGLLVTAVTVDLSSPLHVTVTFSGNIEYVGPGLPENLLVQVAGGDFLPVADLLDSGDDWIEVLIPAEVSAGAGWKIVGPMEGIAPAVAWPQDGVVVAG